MTNRAAATLTLDTFLPSYIPPQLYIGIRILVTQKAGDVRGAEARQAGRTPSIRTNARNFVLETLYTHGLTGRVDIGKFIEVTIVAISGRPTRQVPQTRTREAKATHLIVASNR